MLPAEHQRSSSSVATMAFIGRSVLSLRRNQVVSMEQYHEEELQDLDLFQSYVADRLLSLSSPNDQQGTLSFSFLHKLLDVFLSCKEEFKDLLSRNPGLVAKPPNDKLLSDLLDRSVKSLDICNFVTHNIQFLRHWNRHADISAAAIRNDASLLPGEGQLRRAKKALANLLASFESNHGQEPSRKTERTWSLRYKSGAGNSKDDSSRSLLRSWSALKLGYMSTSLSSPRSAEAGSGLALAVYTMSSVLVFTMWALVAAFPCHERSASFVAAPVGPPRQLAWSASLIGLQERIAEEWRRRGKREGLLVEYVGVERIGREMMELVMGEEGGSEVVTKGTELAEASRRLEEGLGPFERQVREVFHRVVASRAEVMKFLEQNTKSAPPFIVL